MTMRTKLSLFLLVAILACGFIWYVTRDRRSPEERAREYYKKGYLLAERGEFKEAAKCFKKAIKFNPNYTDVYSMLGDCYYQEGKFEKAKQQYKKALELDPNRSATRVAYASCLLKTIKDKKEAQKMAYSELRKLSQKDLSDPLVAYNLACFYAENNRPDLALRYLSYTINTDPSFRQIAKHDRCLDSIRDTDAFKRLVH